jgi:beta-galactosidase
MCQMNYLLLLFSYMLPLATSLSLFGFYSANLTLTASFSNLYQADTISDAQIAHAAGQKTLLLVYDAFFMSVPNQIILRPDWSSSWEALATQAAPLVTSGVLYGFNLGDELVWNCLDPVNLTIAANAVRSSFPTSSGAILWYNEATPPLQSDIDGCGHKNLNFSIPLALDIFSTDLYHMNGPVIGWVESTVKSFYETYIYPRLSSSQKVMLVPGSFGSTANVYPNGSYVCDQHCYDLMCALDANDFYTWAQADPRVVAIMPWNWEGCPGCKECCKDELGTNVQPLATAAWSAIGQKIISSLSSSSSSRSSRSISSSNTLSVKTSPTVIVKTSTPRDTLLDESWRYYYGPGNASTFPLESFNDTLWMQINVPFDGSALPLIPRSEDTINAPVLEIRNGTWLFNRGDNVDWASKNFDDSTWTQTIVPADWRDPPLNFEDYNATGWYRRHFSVQEFQINAAMEGNLRIALGTIASLDQTYLNGQLIGSNYPAGDPDNVGKNCFQFGIYRQYSVPSDLLVSNGGDNVIAVRVTSPGGPKSINNGSTFPGGLFDIAWGDQRIGALDPGASIGMKATGYSVGGYSWYRRIIYTPTNVSEEGWRVFLRFDGVYMLSDTFVNGVFVATHPYGYTTHQYDITSFLHNTTGASNVIAVRVNNKGANSRWYSGSGIYRHVWLTVVPPLHIQLWGVGIDTNVIPGSSATAIVTVSLENDGSSVSNPSVILATLFDPYGTAIASKSIDVPTMQSGEVMNATLPIFSVDTPSLWGLETPLLYTLQAQLQDLVTGALDVVNQTFGFRSIAFSTERGFELNGVTVKLQGGCVHHDNGIIGSAAIDAADWRRVYSLKSLGYNAIRTSHNPVSESFLDAADALGVLVMEEAFDCWSDGKNSDDYHVYFNDWWTRDVYSMVRRDRNHPSIIMWSIGNEIPMKETTEGIALAHNISDWIRMLDPVSGRAITSAIAGLNDKDDPYISALDIPGYNYEDNWSTDYWTDHVRVPNRIMVGTESFPTASFQMWNQVWNLSFVIGDFIWTAIDYIGESAIGSNGYDTPDLLACPGFSPEPFPYHISFCGDVDIAGMRKSQSHYRSVLWNNTQLELVVHHPVASGQSEQIAVWGWEDSRISWTWPGFENKTISIRVYTQYPAVALFLNGVKIIGPNTVGKNNQFTLYADILYQPGILSAVPYNLDGTLIKGVSNVSLQTAGKPALISLSVDRSTVIADRRQLVYVTATVIDSKGVTVPTASGLPSEYQYNLPVVNISFTVESTPVGAGHLYAVGTGDPIDANVMVGASSRTAYRGYVVAIIQPGGNPGVLPEKGTIRVKASANGLPDAFIEIQVVS